jgi:hypothetical protein
MHECDWVGTGLSGWLMAPRWLGCASVKRDCERSNESATPQGIEIEGP